MPFPFERLPMRHAAFAICFACLAILASLTPQARLQAQSVEAARTPPANVSQKDTLAARLSTLWQQETLPTRAFAGLTVSDPATGQSLFSRNATYPFVPASITKLFSTALALRRLKPEYRMNTELLAGGPIDIATGTLRGDLILLGGGDPSLSSRRFPFSRETKDVRDYPIPAFEALVDELVTRGVRSIAGDVVGDDSAYIWSPFREGWAQDDALYGYGAPVSALTVNDNLVELIITPAPKAGAPAQVETLPQLPYYDILNRVLTTPAPADPIEWELAPGRQLLLRGSIAVGARPWRGKVAIDEPALYAAHYLRDALLRRGIAVSGSARARHLLAGDPEPAAPQLALLARHASPPVSEIVRSVNKESVNLFAELLLAEVARASTGLGSPERGLAELHRFLREIGIPADAVSLADASGLARLNLVSPQATILLLNSMWQSPERDAFLDSLPTGGKDGTLENRFTDSPLANQIRAKTGTLRGVNALSGYATTRSGRTLSFSVFVNNHLGSGRAARDFLDKIALAIAGAP